MHQTVLRLIMFSFCWYFYALFLFLQEDDLEVRGERRKTWDDEFVLKRQFSALIPAFDPRPGRTNVNQTQDFEIPAPGKYLYPCKMNVFWGILELACLSVYVSVCPSLCKMLVSVKALAGILSHI